MTVRRRRGPWAQGVAEELRDDQWINEMRSMPRVPLARQEAASELRWRAIRQFEQWTRKRDRLAWLLFVLIPTALLFTGLAVFG